MIVVVFHCLPIEKKYVKILKGEHKILKLQESDLPKTDLEVESKRVQEEFIEQFPFLSKMGVIMTFYKTTEFAYNQQGY